MKYLFLILAFSALIFNISCSKDEELPPPRTNLIEPMLRVFFACYDKNTVWNYVNEKDSSDIAVLSIDQVLVRWDTVGKGITGECAYPECRYQERSVFYALKFTPTFIMNINVVNPFNNVPYAVFVDPTTRQMNQKLSIITGEQGKKTYQYTPEINFGDFRRFDVIEIKNKVYNNVIRMTQYSPFGNSKIEMYWAEGEGIIKYTLPDNKTYELVEASNVKR